MYIKDSDIQNYFFKQLSDKGLIPQQTELEVISETVFDYLIHIGVLKPVDIVDEDELNEDEELEDELDEEHEEKLKNENQMFDYVTRVEHRLNMKNEIFYAIDSLKYLPEKLHISTYRNDVSMKEKYEKDALECVLNTVDSVIAFMNYNEQESEVLNTLKQQIEERFSILEEEIKINDDWVGSVWKSKERRLSDIKEIENEILEFENCNEKLFEEAIEDLERHYKRLWN